MFEPEVLSPTVDFLVNLIGDTQDPHALELAIGTGRVASEHRYVWPSELDLMARLAGMELLRRVADWDGTTFTEDSPSAVSVWRRAD